MPIKVTLNQQLRAVDKRIAQRVAIARQASENLIETQARQSVRAVGGVASGEGVNSIRVLRRSDDKSTVGSDKLQMRLIEYGRRPGKVPRWSEFKSILRTWAAHKGIAVTESRLYLIARKIAREGFKGRFPFKKAAELAEPQVRRIFERTLEGL